MVQWFSADRYSSTEEDQMSEQRPYQRPEKEEEKQHEKEDEKRQEEKWRRDPLGAVLWAAVLIWAGLVLLAINTGYLDTIGLPGLDAWPLIFIGAGVIVLVGVVIRLAVPTYRRAVVGTIIWGLILVGIGLGGLYGWDVIWPLIVIAIGLSILVGGLTRRRPQ
jgi:Na+/melibiose symporter-like transporter